MERKRRREFALGGLALALIGFALWRVGGPVPSAPSRAVVKTAPTQANQPKSGVDEIDLAMLQAKRPEPEEISRNPFRFKPKAPPPPPPGPVTPPGAPGRGGPGVAAPGSAPVARIPLKFIGLMNRADSKAGSVAILSDARGVYYGREGETIEGRYRIVRIGVESIELAYLDSSGRQTIRLTGQ